MTNLDVYTTKELVEELESREGVEVKKADPFTLEKIIIEGPAIILVVVD